jgi:hypothetical protein
MPVVLLNSPAVSNGSNAPAFGTGEDIAGIIVWATGWIIESVADAQKVGCLSGHGCFHLINSQYQYKSSQPPKDIPMQASPVICFITVS